jgi:hypothetical protein
MKTVKCALFCCIFAALFACNGNVKPLAKPARPTAESVRRLLGVMHFDEVVAQLLQNVDVSTRAAMAGVAEKQVVNAEQRRLFDELVEHMIGVLDYEYSWDHFGPVLITTIQAAYSQQDVGALLSIFESPAGQEVAAQLGLAAQDLVPGLMGRLDGIHQERQTMAEVLESRLASLISPSARDAFAAFANTAVGQDIVARTPAWHAQYEEQLVLLKADGVQRMQAIRDQYKERIKAASGVQ